MTEFFSIMLYFKRKGANLFETYTNLWRLDNHHGARNTTRRRTSCAMPLLSTLQRAPTWRLEGEARCIHRRRN